MSDSEFLPDGSWADPLSRSERSMVAGMLARAAKASFWARTASYRPEAGRWEDANARAVARHVRTSAEMSDLRLDVTERASTARATTECRVHGEVPDDHFPCRVPGETADQFTNRALGYWRDV
jgi:hypothetical protein